MAQGLRTGVTGESARVFRVFTLAAGKRGVESRMIAVAGPTGHTNKDTKPEVETEIEEEERETLQRTFRNT